VHKELKMLMDKNLGVMQLHTAKQQFIGQLAISFESNLNDALSMAKSLLVYNTVDTHEMMIGKINALSSGELTEAARQVFRPEDMSMLVYKNRKA
jgi:predicted Zn-dependent peptidase